MRMVVHEVFHVLEAHYIVHDDSPVMGAYEYVKTREVKHGPYETERGARNKVRSLIDKYTLTGYKQHVDGSFNLSDSGHCEISFSVEKEVLSRSPVK